MSTTPNLWQKDLDRAGSAWAVYSISISDFLGGISEAGKYVLRLDLIEAGLSQEERGLFPPSPDVMVSYCDLHAAAIACVHPVMHVEIMICASCNTLKMD
jgi:hypothetical protein